MPAFETPPNLGLIFEDIVILVKVRKLVDKNPSIWV